MPKVWVGFRNHWRYTYGISETEQADGAVCNDESPGVAGPIVAQPFPRTHPVSVKVLRIVYEAL